LVSRDVVRGQPEDGDQGRGAAARNDGRVDNILRIQIKPVVPIEKSQGIYEKAVAWRDSIK